MTTGGSVTHGVTHRTYGAGSSLTQVFEHYGGTARSRPSIVYQTMTSDLFFDQDESPAMIHGRADGTVRCFMAGDFTPLFSVPK